MAQKHRIVETSFGEVMLKESADKTYCEVYIGDNYDQFVCDVDCSLNDSEENILEQLEEKLYY